MVSTAHARNEGRIRRIFQHLRTFTLYFIIVEVSLTDGELDSWINRKGCGVSEPTGRVFNGEAISKLQIPWIVMIQTPEPGTDFAYACGGSIITQNVVLTAAHCTVFSYSIEEVRIYYNTTEPSEGPVNYAESRMVHRKFNRQTGAKYDVALLKMREPFKFDRFVKPVCLPTREIDVTNKRLLAAGWGDTSNEATRSGPSNLLYVEVDGMSHEECERIIQKSISSDAGGLDASVSVCARGRGNALCHGDSGAPVTLRPKGKRSVQVGVYSAGSGCQSKHAYAICASVWKFMPWIRQALSEPDEWQAIPDGTTE